MEKKIRSLVLSCTFIVVCFVGIATFFTYHTRISHIIPYIVPHGVVLGAQVSEASTVSANSQVYGVGVDMSQLLPTSQAYVVNSKGEDLIDIAAKLGIKIFRITNATDAFPNNNRTYTKTEWDMVLNKMQKKGIKAVILIEGPQEYQKYITSAYLPFVQSYIINSGVMSNPDVYGVDLYNEPVINSTNNLFLLRSASRMIKARYPFARVTVGWWAIDTFQKDADGREVYQWDNYAAGKTLSSFIDFYAIHMYGFDQQFFGFYPDPYLYTKNFIADVKSGLQTTKPILIEEFGAANGEAVSDQDTLGSQELQGNTYAGVYQALIDMHDPQIVGAIAYQYNTRAPGPDAWAIIGNKGDYLSPAAYVLQTYATGRSDAPLTLPINPIPSDYLLTNQDNNRTLIVHVNDVIGFKLLLDPTSGYTITADNAVLTQAQGLTFDSVSNRYDAVYHAAHVGSTTVGVYKGKNEVYSITVNVNN